jgi:hypothetical protein
MDQSPLKNVKIDCIKDPKTEEIIYPDEMQKKCIVSRLSPSVACDHVLSITAACCTKAVADLYVEYLQLLGAAPFTYDRIHVARCVLLTHQVCHGCYLTGKDHLSAHPPLAEISGGLLQRP